MCYVKAYHLVRQKSRHDLPHVLTVMGIKGEEIKTHKYMIKDKSYGRKKQNAPRRKYRET